VPAQASGPGDGVPPFLERARVADAALPVSLSLYLRLRLAALFVIKEKAVVHVGAPTAAVRWHDGGSAARVEAAGADAVLRADERLHGAHGLADLATHLVAAHQGLQPHQAAQRAQRPPRLNTTSAHIQCHFILNSPASNMFLSETKRFSIFFCIRNTVIYTLNRFQLFNDKP
jgi:hypothetical protein